MTAPSKSPEQIEDEIRTTRREIDRTLDALQNKLSPGQLLDQALGYVRSGGGEFAANLGRSVSQNPLPVTLLGIGVAWLMIAGQTERSRGGEPWRSVNRPSPRREGNGDVGAGFADDRERDGEGLGDSVEAAASTVRDWSRDARDRMHAAGDAAGDFARRTGDTASDAVHRAGDYAHSAWHQGKDATSRMLHDYPLAIGAVGLAAGALAAATLPTTRRENELMGEAADELKNQARTAVSGAARKAAAAAEEVAETAASATGTRAEPSQAEAEGEGSGASGAALDDDETWRREAR